ncbi:hypothetical protein J7L13_03860 [bacterium]|nr:hypothetical protein [bacterium]
MNGEQEGAHPETEKQETSLWELISRSAREIAWDHLEEIEEWRRLDKQSPQAKKIRQLVEILTAGVKASSDHPHRKEEIAQLVLDRLGLREVNLQETRVQQFLAFFSSLALQTQPPQVLPEVEKIVKGLQRLATPEGEVNGIEVITSPTIPLRTKKDWLLFQVLPRIRFLNNLDIKDAQKPPSPPKLPKAPSQPPFPPPDQEEMQPSMEEQEKGKKPPSPWFIITPFYGGYYREQIWGEWDPTRAVFKQKPARNLRPVRSKEAPAVEEGTERVMQGVILPGKPKILPCPYGFVFLPESLQTAGGKAELLQDEEGNFYIQAKGSAPVAFSLTLARTKEEPKQPQSPPSPLKIETGPLSQDIEDLLQELSQDSSLPPLQKARRLKAFLRQILRYPRQGDSALNAFYQQNPQRFFQEIDRHRVADCDVANAFFVALLSRLGIPARLITGYYVKLADQKGRAVLTSAQRHAWTEIWDNGWHRLDVTPSGAPEMDEEETDEKEPEEFEGDFGEEEAKLLSEEELEELKKKMKELHERLQEAQLPPKQQRELYFARQAHCSLEKARQILAEIEKALSLRDSRGRLIVERLSQEFQRIVRQNLKKVPQYKSPVRMSEGDELEEPALAMIDVRSGETNPAGFARYETEEKLVQEYGGFDVILVVDKSDSMKWEDPTTGEPKYLEQQRFVFLVMEALHRFSTQCRRKRLQMLTPLDIRVALITFQAGGAKVVLPLTEQWGPPEQLAVWEALGTNIGGGTPDHLGLQTAHTLIEQDTARQKKIKENVVIVEGVGLGPAAQEIEATYYPLGKCLRSVAEAPEWVAERIIANVRRLYPQKVRGERTSPA